MGITGTFGPPGYVHTSVHFTTTNTASIQYIRQATNPVKYALHLTRLGTGPVKYVLHLTRLGTGPVKYALHSLRLRIGPVKYTLHLTESGLVQCNEYYYVMSHQTGTGPVKWTSNASGTTDRSTLACRQVH